MLGHLTVVASLVAEHGPGVRAQLWHHGHGRGRGMWDLRSLAGTDPASQPFGR